MPFSLVSILVLAWTGVFATNGPETPSTDSLCRDALPGTALETRMNPSISRSLQGLLPGVDISFTDGEPASTGTFSLRGGTPLFLVDGVPVTDFSGIDPLEIESVEVLKHTAASVLYGTRAAYGAIAVTTRKGRQGVHVQYDGSVGFSTMVPDWKNGLVTDGLVWTEAYYEAWKNAYGHSGSDSYNPLAINKIPINMGSRDYLDAFRELRRNGADHPVYGSELGNSGQFLYFGSTDWVDAFYRDAMTGQRHHVRIDGGMDHVQFRLSGGVFSNNGIYRAGDFPYRQIDLSGDIRIAVFPFLHIGGFARLQKRKSDTPFLSSGSGKASTILYSIAQYCPPVSLPRNEDGTWTISAAYSLYSAYSEGNYCYTDKQDNYALGGNVRLDIMKDILFLEGSYTHQGKTLSSSLMHFPISGSLYPGQDFFSYSGEYTYIRVTNASWRPWNVGCATLHWNPRLGRRHRLSAVAGLERQRYFSDSETHYTDYVDESYGKNWSESHSEYSADAFYGTLDYLGFGRYGLTLSARSEKQSLFPDGEPSTTLWGCTASWHIAQEPWMGWIRPSVGDWTVFCDLGEAGHQWTVYLSEPGQDLRLERLGTFSVGSEIRLADNRLSLRGEWYGRNRKEIITTVDAPAIYGGTGFMPVNSGRIRTRGWELSLGWEDRRIYGGSPLAYGIRAHLWDSRSFYMEGEGYFEGKEWESGVETGEIRGFRTDGYFLSNQEADAWVPDEFHRNGYDFKAYAGDLKFKDLNENGKIDYGVFGKDDREVIGNCSPRYRFGITLHASWKGFGAEAVLQGIGKQDWYYSGPGDGLFYGMRELPYGLYPADQAGDTVEIDYSTDNWTVVNAGAHPYWTRRIGYVADSSIGTLSIPNDYYLQSLAYLRLKNLTLSYTLPREWMQKIRMESCKVYYSAENLLTLSPVRRRNRLMDPEMDIQTTSYPVMATHALGVSLAF